MNSEKLRQTVTNILNEHLSDGACDELFNKMYPSIKVLARHELSKLNPGQQLSPTLLVNECYLKLKLGDAYSFKSKKHFYNTVARCMRFFLVDTVRQHYRLKRQGVHTELQLSQVAGDEDIALDLLILNDVIDQLDSIDPELAMITQYKFFSGLTFEEIAEIYECSISHVFKQWNMARSFLVTLLEDKQ